MSWLALVATLEARPALVAVGAGVYWRDGCVAAIEGGSGPIVSPECQDSERALRYADDDAWRAALLLGPLAAEGDVRVLTRTDASTHGRTFAGGAPGAPTRAALFEAVRSVAGGAEPVRLILYLAAHGTSERIYLEDGAWSVAALRQEILDVLGPEGELLLIGDVCLSARWRSAPSTPRPTSALGYPPVGAMRGRQVAIGADGLAAEDPAVGGGVLSWVALSGLMGAADADLDGTVLAQELSDHLHAYVPSLPTPVTPVVRAPHGLGTWPLPRPVRGGALRMGGGAASRWTVTLPDGTPLAEIFTPAGTTRRLALPVGRYAVHEQAVGPAGDGRAPSGLARAYAVTIEAGADTRVHAVPAVVRDGVAPPPTAYTPRPGPSGWARYHRSARPVASVSAAGVVGELFDDRVLLGLEVGVARGPLGLGWFALNARWQPPGGAWPSTALGASLLGGLDLPVASGRATAVTVRVGAGLGGDTVLTSVGPYGTLGLAGRVGPSVAWAPPGRPWLLRLTAAWEPAFWLVEDDVADAGTLRFDATRAGLALGVGWRL